MAAQLTEIVKDPMIAASLPIRNLEASADGRTFTFEVTSTIDAKTEEKRRRQRKRNPRQAKKRYSISATTPPPKKLTHLKDKEEEKKQLDWPRFHPTGRL